MVSDVGRGSGAYTDDDGEDSHQRADQRGCLSGQADRASSRRPGPGQPEADEQIRRLYNLDTADWQNSTLIRPASWTATHRFTWQRPARRAVERNDEAVEQWVKKRWPQLKKGQGARTH